MNPDKASPPAWQGMLEWHGADEPAPGWELELELAGNAQGWVTGLAEPCCPCVPPSCPPGHKGSLPQGFCPLPAHVGTGRGVGQTDRKLPAPKGQAQLEPGPCLESRHQPGASSEQPLRGAARVVRAGVGGGSVALEPWLIGVRVSGKWPRSRLAPMAFFSLEKQPCPGCAVQGEEQGWGSGGVAHGWVWQLGPVP